jgi:rubrerythrin
MSWYEYFVRNAATPNQIPWELGINIEPHLRADLIRSLQRFQVGEQGDGKHLIMGADKTGDKEYADTIKLFISEEQGHARLLALLITGMGGSLLSWHWSDACFVLVRRMLGLRMELLVLLTAEMIAKRYYQVLYDGTTDPVLRAAFAKILSDEFGHVAFHCDYLWQAFRSLAPLSRFSICWLWYVFFATVCVVVAHDHRGVLKATGVPTREFRHDCALIFEETAARIFSPTPWAEQTFARETTTNEVSSHPLLPLSVLEAASVPPSK